MNLFVTPEGGAASRAGAACGADVQDETQFQQLTSQIDQRPDALRRLRPGRPANAGRLPQPVARPDAWRTSDLQLRTKMLQRTRASHADAPGAFSFETVMRA